MFLWLFPRGKRVGTLRQDCERVQKTPPDEAIRLLVRGETVHRGYSESATIRTVHGILALFLSSYLSPTLYRVYRCAYLKMPIISSQTF